MEEGGAVAEGDDLGEGVGSVGAADEGCVADLEGLLEGEVVVWGGSGEAGCGVEEGGSR